MDKVNSHPSGQAVTGAQQQRLAVPSSVPEIEDVLLHAAIRRSPRAKRLDDKLCKREHQGKPLSSSEVKQMVKDATGPDGKPDGDQAVVIASHAHKHPEVFGGAHDFLLRFLARVEWVLLLVSLRAFIATLHESEAAERAKSEIKRDREIDKVVEDERRPQQLLGDDRKKAAEQQRRQVAGFDGDEELTATSRLRLTTEHLKRR